MTFKLEIWVEGATDARTHSTRDQGEGDNRPVISEGGVLVPLLRKALLASDRVTEKMLAERLPEGRVEAHLLTRKLRNVVQLGGGGRRAQLSNHARKVLAAID